MLGTTGPAHQQERRTQISRGAQALPLKSSCPHGARHAHRPPTPAAPTAGPAQRTTHQPAQGRTGLATGGLASAAGPQHHPEHAPTSALAPELQLRNDSARACPNPHPNQSPAPAADKNQSGDRRQCRGMPAGSARRGHQSIPAAMSRQGNAHGGNRREALADRLRDGLLSAASQPSAFLVLRSSVLAQKAFWTRPVFRRE